MHVAHRRSVGERVEQDRRGQVVGQVADQAEWRIPGKRREVDVHHVGVQQGQRAVRLRRRSQGFQQVAVELDRSQRPVPIQERKRQRALTRADLDNTVAGARVDRHHQFVDNAAVVQEVLAQRFLRWMLEAGVRGIAVHAVSLRAMRARARRVQVWMAANRLEGSAVPRPASSSAVPWSTATRG